MLDKKIMKEAFEIAKETMVLKSMPIFLKLLPAAIILGIGNGVLTMFTTNFMVAYNGIKNHKI